MGNVSTNTERGEAVHALCGCSLTSATTGCLGKGKKHGAERKILVPSSYFMDSDKANAANTLSQQARWVE